MIKCIKNFYSLSGELVFKEGIIYPINQHGIIDNGEKYYLHYIDRLIEYFIKNNN